MLERLQLGFISISLPLKFSSYFMGFRINCHFFPLPFFKGCQGDFLIAFHRNFC